jgi:DNA polymerase I-like protein with 3'-5' exonuclease and polymerase domains
MHLSPNSKEAYKLFHDGTLAFARAEQRGMKIDVEYCQKKKLQLSHKIELLEDEFKQTKFWTHWQHVYGAKANIQSGPQLSHILYDVKKIKPVKGTAKGRGSTDAEALLELGIPELETRIQISKLLKVRDTYLDAILRETVNGIIHPFFNLHLVKTYRSSSDHINWQNIPKRDDEMMNICRRAVLPSLGFQIFEPDFSGIEVCMACIYTEDPKLIYDTLHGDMHKDMAIELYKLDSLDKKHHGEAQLRQGGKNGFVFPEFYGDFYGNCVKGLLDWASRSTLKNGTPGLVHMSDKGLIKLDKNGNVNNVDVFTEHVKKVEDMFWNERYRTYKKWKDRTWSDYQKRGYVDLLTGFRCSGVMGRKEVGNYPFQGTAFHCLLWSFVHIDEIQTEKHWASGLTGQIHDSMLIDTHPSELPTVAKTVKKVTCEDLTSEWKWISIPLKIDAEICDVDMPWNTKKSFSFEKEAA